MLKERMGRIIAFGMSVFVLLLTASVTQAAAWEARGKALFEKDEYEQCIRYLDPYKKDKLAMLLLGYCHLQESILTESKEQKASYDAYRERISEQLTLDDINDVYYFVSQIDKPVVVDDASRLAGEIFDGINNVDDLERLIPFMTVEDERTRNMAFSTVVRILKPKRKYVDQGGTLRSKDVKAMSSQALINALLDGIEASGSRKALEMIEEPVLAYVGNYPSEQSVKLEKKIRSEVEKRLKRYPDSNWYSAVGKER